MVTIDMITYFYSLYFFILYFKMLYLLLFFIFTTLVYFYSLFNFIILLEMYIFLVFFVYLLFILVQLIALFIFLYPIQNFDNLDSFNFKYFLSNVITKFSKLLKKISLPLRIYFVSYPFVVFILSTYTYAAILKVICILTSYFLTPLIFLVFFRSTKHPCTLFHGIIH